MQFCNEVMMLTTVLPHCETLPTKMTDARLCHLLKITICLNLIIKSSSSNISLKGLDIVIVY